MDPRILLRNLTARTILTLRREDQLQTLAKQNGFIIFLQVDTARAAIEDLDDHSWGHCWIEYQPEQGNSRQSNLEKKPAAGGWCPDKKHVYAGNGHTADRTTGAGLRSSSLPQVPGFEVTGDQECDHTKEAPSQPEHRQGSQEPDSSSFQLHLEAPLQSQLRPVARVNRRAKDAFSC